jgi:hypothetical protein
MKRVVRNLARLVLASLPLAFSASANAEDHGVVTLWCKGTAHDNDDAQGRDERIKTSEKQGKATVDFDALQVDFLNWSRIKISDVTYSRIQADQNAFETGNGHHIRMDRITGEVGFQSLIHDAKSGETWYSHTFSGKCAKTDKQGRASKTKPEATGF